MSAEMALDPTGPWFKLVLLGEAGVGKTSVFHRLRDGMFRSPQKPTICIDSCTRAVQIGDQVVKLTIWDTAGVERFRTLTRNYYRNAHGAILMYSVADPFSLPPLSRWAQDVHSFCPLALKFAWGNKADLDENVSRERARELAETCQCDSLFLTSAKTGKGIESALKTIAEKLLDHYDRRARKESMNIFDDSIDINKNQKSQSSCSC
ncbi:ras-related protein Rab-35-like [Liolophura sinensis]|uniref:ras-related protein Rab-35-like n=1 Tax=Liolophura sinensis TaxID=3198878 RepID=UPI0031583774